MKYEVVMLLAKLGTLVQPTQSFIIQEGEHNHGKQK